MLSRRLVKHNALTFFLELLASFVFVFVYLSLCVFLSEMFSSGLVTLAHWQAKNA